MHTTHASFFFLTARARGDNGRLGAMDSEVHITVSSNLASDAWLGLRSYIVYGTLVAPRSLEHGHRGLSRREAPEVSLRLVSKMGKCDAGLVIACTEGRISRGRSRRGRFIRPSGAWPRVRDVPGTRQPL